MARLLTRQAAKELGLPGRRSLEFVSGESGARAVTLRLVEIPVPGPSEKPRGRHFHSHTEECIYVLAGSARLETPEAQYALQAGDAILIPAGEEHVTRNTGTETLKLLCFFPTARVTNRDAMPAKS